MRKFFIHIDKNNNTTIHDDKSIQCPINKRNRTLSYYRNDREGEIWECHGLPEAPSRSVDRIFTVEEFKAWSHPGSFAPFFFDGQFWRNASTWSKWRDKSRPTPEFHRQTTRERAMAHHPANRTRVNLKAEFRAKFVFRHAQRIGFAAFDACLVSYANILKQ